MIFIHIIQPIDGMDDEDGDEWEGMVKRMTNVSTKHIKALGKVLGKKVDELQKSVDDFKTLDSQQDSGLKQQVDRKFSALEAKMDENLTATNANIGLILEAMARQKDTEPTEPYQKQDPKLSKDDRNQDL